MPYDLEYASKGERNRVRVLATPAADANGHHVFAPLQATGDGNCLIHSVSKAIFGVECWYQVLRNMVVAELLEHKPVVVILQSALFLDWAPCCFLQRCGLDFHFRVLLLRFT